MRLILKEQSDLGLHCLHMPFVRYLRKCMGLTKAGRSSGRVVISCGSNSRILLYWNMVFIVIFNSKYLRKWSKFLENSTIFIRDKHSVLVIHFYNPKHNSGGVLWFHIGCPCVCPSVSCTSIAPSLFCFRMTIWIYINGFSWNLVCALIL